jgi:predicted N-acetyltransferase YhbS
MPANPQPDIVIRSATPQDIPTCGQICYDAFSTLNAAHGFPCDFPSPEVALGAIDGAFTAPGFYSIVAEADGQILGSNCLDERSIIHGVGPITVNPNTQNKGVGRKLMQAVMERSREQGAAGMRLVQAAFHTRSMSLYTSLGFDIREPLAVMQGRTQQRSVAGRAVRAATLADLGGCNLLSYRVHGFDRSVDVASSIDRGTALVAECEGRITAYASHLGFFGHATAENQHRPAGPHWVL